MPAVAVIRALMPHSGCLECSGTMGYQTLKITRDDQETLHVGLNRPDVRNAFNPILIQELTAVFCAEARDPKIRAVVLYGSGPTFSAGADLNWMKESISYSKEKNLEDARQFAQLLSLMDTTPCPLLGRVHGATMGGGLGLVSVCDYVIADRQAVFSFSEARLGLIPAVIGPFVLRKIGASQTRALFLTAEKFHADQALHLGLVHHVCANELDLDGAIKGLIREILQLSPHALRECKQFLHQLQIKPPNEHIELSAQALAHIRTTKQAQEGVGAFLEKKKPSWCPP